MLSLLKSMASFSHLMNCDVQAPAQKWFDHREWTTFFIVEISPNTGFELFEKPGRVRVSALDHSNAPHIRCCQG